LNTIKITNRKQRPKFPSLWDLGDPIKLDWYGKLSTLAPQFLCSLDATHFHFLAGDRNRPTIHPEARPGKFQPELWKYDVAEFFLASSDGSSYLEFNLAPNGAWWSAFFEEPRLPLDRPPLAGVETYGEQTDDGWQVRASIPLSEIGFTPESLLNVTFILGTPEQRFFSTAPLSSAEPDFHRPTEFLPMSLSS
jgi:hypothetical protein